MRIVVTGGSGRAGVWTVRDFAEHGHEVINLDGRAPAEPLPGAFIKLDLTDAGEVYDAFVQTQPDAVCHLAANPSPSGFPRQQTFANNVLSTYNVMQAAGDSVVADDVQLVLGRVFLVIGRHPHIGDSGHVGL